MDTVRTHNPALGGAVFAVLAATCFSINDALIKSLSDGYPLHQIVFVRALVGIVVLMALVIPLTEGYRALGTRRPLLHLARGLFIFFANLTFFLGLAALPLAEAVAIFFISPLIIALASIVFLGEQVGPRRWAAIAVGLVGVLIMLRPGSQAFQVAALLPIAAAIGYTGLHILTRKIGTADSLMTMSISVQIVFLTVSLLIGAALGDGRFGDVDHPSLQFLFRAWAFPSLFDLSVMILSGLLVAGGGVAITQAYRTSEAALIAPFEYVALPLSVLWGFLFFAEWPDGVAFFGIALILGSGLVLIWREAVAKRAIPDDDPIPPTRDTG